VNVLVIAPHPDDESIGCGGTICLHADRGDRVAAVFLTSGESGLPDLPKEEARRMREREAEKAAAILGIGSAAFLRRPDGCVGNDSAPAADALRTILEHEEPEIVYVTHERDWHPDHRASVAIVQTALHGSGIPDPILLSYEVLTPLAEYDRAEDISPVIELKMKAVRAHASQVRQLRYDLAMRALNKYRGIVTQAGSYAEVFRVANGCLQGVPLELRAQPLWHRDYEAAQEIKRLIPEQDSFILVDEGHLDAAPLVSLRRRIPFLEKDGRYWGKPQDDAAAIRELERLRESGASFLVFVCSAFWWLDYYQGLSQYLHTEFACIRQDQRLVVFDLRRRRAAH
jgi:LmbE family N-acetylglucosaminyl deacetylase